MRRKYKWLAVRPIHASHHYGSTLQPLLLMFVHYTVVLELLFPTAHKHKRSPLFAGLQLYTVRHQTISGPNAYWGECRLCMYRIVAGYD